MIKDGPVTLVRFPPGQPLISDRPFDAAVFREVDAFVAAGRCASGRFEIETAESRLTCLVHRSAIFLAGLLERNVYSQVPLYDLVDRSAQLADSTCRLVGTSSPEVMMEAVHFCRRPALRSTTILVDPAHVLGELEKQRRDAALVFERSGARTLMFLLHGRPARLFFGDPEDDPGQGGLEERMLAYAFAPEAPPGIVEVFTDLKVQPDPDAGTTLRELEEQAKPPPPVDVCLELADGREVRRRPFTAPQMIIGRDPAADLFVDNLAVSRQHARLTWEKGAFVVEDLESANGTEVNGEPVSRAALAPGDRIGIGKFEISIFEYDTMPRVADTMYMPLKKALPPAFLECDGERFRLERDLILGRGSGVDVAVQGLFVLPVHARVSFEEGGRFRLTCFGRATARVNGDRVRAAELEPGDRMAIGRSRLRLVTTASPPEVKA